jgi:urease accessory protein
LSNGAVLLLEHDRAIVVRLKEEAWLSLVPRDGAAALELGYFAGNMHWPVRFEGTTLRIALHGPVQGYLERLDHLMRDGRVRRADHE